MTCVLDRCSKQHFPPPQSCFLNKERMTRLAHSFVLGRVSAGCTYLTHLFTCSSFIGKSDEFVTYRRERQQSRVDATGTCIRAGKLNSCHLKTFFHLMAYPLFAGAANGILARVGHSLPRRDVTRRARTFFQDRFVLATELQQYVAGNTQRVAKLICHKADFEVRQRQHLSAKEQGKPNSCKCCMVDAIFCSFFLLMTISHCCFFLCIRAEFRSTSSRWIFRVLGTAKTPLFSLAPARYLAARSSTIQAGVRSFPRILQVYTR